MSARVPNLREICSRMGWSMGVRKCGGMRHSRARAATLRIVDKLKRMTRLPSGERHTTCRV